MKTKTRMLALLGALAIPGLGILAPGAALASDGDAAAGKTVVQRQCATCHIDAAEGPRRLGPTLFGLIGRKTGAIEGFRYTEANRNAGFSWTPEKLDEYLRNPRAVIPGTNMAFAGIRSDKDRADVVAYIKGLK
jgi:cytochrome c